MVEYNYLELLKAIRLCSYKQGYSVIVFAKTGKRAENIFKEAKDAIYNDSDELQVLDVCTNRPGAFNITYRNGSIMRFTSSNENVRGYRANCAIYDDAMDSRDLVSIIERPYMEENNETSRRV